ncbi:polysaccharide deacetylase family protein [Sphingomonas sp. CBMAI 2297]|uniref:polysaccharide deacetylase family protein n=1 Tax=Sphingomonas sp. CBMAI 2297 TaxID=2991720 RepID=UPI0024540660|nr:polysaccharide deacetylase family protein [Sphingomonas sp. CBMAI 2297]MDH4745626.1 polysaccharide deacetylase family protein [Sphingomonas sp. CBMAI 2297]
MKTGPWRRARRGSGILAATLLLPAMLHPAQAQQQAAPPAAGRRVAITFDDLPYVHASAPEAGGKRAAADANRAIVAVLKRQRVPATGFVTEQHVRALGDAGPDLLREWNRGLLELGNHGATHADSNRLDVDGIGREVADGEATIRPMAEAAGRKLRFFRFPYNHVGDTAEKRQAAEALLAGRGYRLAAATIDTSDYVFDQAYERALAGADDWMRRRIEEAYLAHSRTQIAYYAALDRTVLGYEPPAILLLHLNRLNAATLDRLLRLVRQQGYRFVSLDEAQSDPAYRESPRVATKYGPMWGYRWANERQVKVDGSKEQEPPEWVARYAEGK